MTEHTMLILGAAVWPGGQASPALMRRITHAARLWHHAGRGGLAPIGRIICCGGLGRHAPSEAEVIARELRALGVPPEALVIEDRSTSTIGNIREARHICPDLDQVPVVIVTERYHAFRACVIARRLGLKAHVNWPDEAGLSRVTRRRARLRETFALLKLGAWVLSSGVRPSGGRRPGG